jgi:hypothetical protein
LSFKDGIEIGLSDLFEGTDESGFDVAGLGDVYRAKKTCPNLPRPRILPSEKSAMVRWWAGFVEAVVETDSL